MTSIVRKKAKKSCLWNRKSSRIGGLNCYVGLVADLAGRGVRGAPSRLLRRLLVQFRGCYVHLLPELQHPLIQAMLSCLR